MKKSDVGHYRIDPELKKDVEEIFKRIGINSSQAISMFFSKVRNINGLPFDVNLKDTNRVMELASVLSSLGGKEHVDPKRERIIELYADGSIDYETACFAIKRSFK